MLEYCVFVSKKIITIDYNSLQHFKNLELKLSFFKSLAVNDINEAFDFILENKYNSIISNSGVHNLSLLNLEKLIEINYDFKINEILKMKTRNKTKIS